MTDSSNVISLFAAFVAGLTGSAHCFSMCGAIAGAFGMRARMQQTSGTNAVASALPYHFGRLGGYALAGAAFGLAGEKLQTMIDIGRTGAWLRMASGVLLLLIAIRLLSPFNPLRWLEIIGAKVWRHLQPLAQTAAKLPGGWKAPALGLLWSLLPCGLIYSMLLFASLSGSAIDGGAILLAFGLGTLPAMLTSTVLAARTQQLLRQRWPSLASGTLMLIMGAWMVWVSAPTDDHSHHHHPTMTLAGSAHTPA